MLSRRDEVGTKKSGKGQLCRVIYVTSSAPLQLNYCWVLMGSVFLKVRTAANVDARRDSTSQNPPEIHSTWIACLQTKQRGRRIDRLRKLKPVILPARYIEGSKKKDNMRRWGSYKYLFRWNVAAHSGDGRLFGQKKLYHINKENLNNKEHKCEAFSHSYSLIRCFVYAIQTWPVLKAFIKFTIMR